MSSGQLESYGFTIIETLIFLAVSSVILVSALALINGAQDRAAFTQGINDIEQQVDSVINTVATGYTASQGNVVCSVGSGGVLNISSSSTAPPLGSDDGCIFVGHVMQFTNGTNFVTYSIAGDRTVPGSNAAQTDTTQDNLTLISPVSENGLIQNNLKVYAMFYGDNSGYHPTSAVGFFGSLGSNDANTGDLASGSQQVNLVAFPSSPAISSSAAFSPANPLYSTPSPPIINPANGVTICFDGGPGRYGQLTIGGNGRATGTTLKILSTKTATGTSC